MSHFSEQSLNDLMAEAGFIEFNVDCKIHDAAFVVSAKLAAAPRPSEQSAFAGTEIGFILPFQGRRLGYFYL